jgi:hypothetical protein
MDEATAERVATLYDHLAATDSPPIAPRANQWLGEAEAVVADLHHNDATSAVVRDRAAHVVHLLENVDDTGSDDADDHVTAALALARELTAEPNSE